MKNKKQKFLAIAFLSILSLSSLNAMYYGDTEEIQESTTKKSDENKIAETLKRIKIETLITWIHEEALLKSKNFFDFIDLLKEKCEKINLDTDSFESPEAFYKTIFNQGYKDTGNGILHTAYILGKDSNFTTTLINMGADRKLKNKNNQTARELLQSNLQPVVVWLHKELIPTFLPEELPYRLKRIIKEQLIQNGLYPLDAYLKEIVKSADKNGNTCLHVAYAYGKSDAFIKKLIELGACHIKNGVILWPKNKAGQLPIDCKEQKMNPDSMINCEDYVVKASGENETINKKPCFKSDKRDKKITFDTEAEIHLFVDEIMKNIVEKNILKKAKKQ